MFTTTIFLTLASACSAFVIPQPVFRSFHSQDELGGFHFGYSGGPSSRAEHRDHLGVVRGSYNLVDGNGIVQKYEYVAGPHGYNLISGSGLPVAPEVPDVPEVVLPVAPALPVVTPLVAPVPVDVTPEVAAATAAHEAARAEALAAATAAVADVEPVAAATQVANDAGTTAEHTA